MKKQKNKVSEEKKGRLNEARIVRQKERRTKENTTRMENRKIKDGKT